MHAARYLNRKIFVYIKYPFIRDHLTVPVGHFHLRHIKYRELDQNDAVAARILFIRKIQIGNNKSFTVKMRLYCVCYLAARVSCISMFIFKWCIAIAIWPNLVHFFLCCVVLCSITRFYCLPALLYINIILKRSPLDLL